MKFFGSLKAERLVNQLIVFREHDTPEAGKVIEKLRGIGAPAIPKLIDALPTANREQTVTIVDLLAGMVGPKTLSEFVKGLKYENQRAVAGVAWAMTSRNNYDPNALIELLEDPEIPKANLLEILNAHKERLNIRQFLSHVYDLSPNDKATSMRIVNEIAKEALLPELLSRIEGKDPVVRAHLIKTVARFPTPEVQSMIQRQLGDRSKLVRQAALSALASLGGSADIKTLVNLLTDPEVDVQNKAVDVICRLNHPDTMKHLLGVLTDESEYARRSAVEVLNEIGTTDSIKDLLLALKDDDWWVRSRATDALAKIGGPRVVDATLELIKDPEEPIRRAAIEILNSTEDPRAVKHLIQVTRDPDWWVRERAVDALVSLEAKDAVPALMMMLSQDPKSVPAALRGIAALGNHRNIGGILPLLERPEPEIKIEGIAALVRLTNEQYAEQVVRSLQKLSKDQNQTVIERAVEGLSEMDERYSATAVAEIAKAEQFAEPAHTLLIDNAPSELRRTAEISQSKLLDLGELAANQVIEGRYKFIQHIGKGAFGTVILVEDSVVEERLVLKFLNQNIASDEEMMQRFVHELRYSRKITHKNVIRIYDFLHLGGLYAISMEYFPSHTLGGEIRKPNGIEIPRTLTIARDITLGMSAAHQVGIVHRDLKPANILINDQQLVKVVDFGVAAAHSSGDTALTKTGYVIGSPKYMAPEQILGKKVDQRADIYSAGVILYEMLCGTPPYTEGDHMSVMYQHVQGGAKPVDERNPKIAPEIAALVTKVMSVDKMDRYQTMEEFRQALLAVM